jgi:hypothetical protein
VTQVTGVSVTKAKGSEVYDPKRPGGGGGGSGGGGHGPKPAPGPTHAYAHTKAPTPAPTPLLDAIEHNDLAVGLAVYVVQSVILILCWRCCVAARKAEQTVFSDDDADGPAPKLDLNAVRDRLQYSSGGLFLSALFFWAWAVYNIHHKKSADLGIITFFCALLSHGCGLASLGKRPAEKPLASANQMFALWHRDSVLLAHILVFLNYEAAVFIRPKASKQFKAYCILFGLLWLVAGMLARGLAGKWCRLVCSDGWQLAKTTDDADDEEEASRTKKKAPPPKPGSRTIVNGVLGAPAPDGFSGRGGASSQPSAGGGGNGRPLSAAGRRALANAQAAAHGGTGYAPFSGAGQAVGSGGVPKTRVLRQSDYTKVSDERALEDDALFAHLAAAEQEEADDDFTAGRALFSRVQQHETYHR